VRKLVLTVVAMALLVAAPGAGAEIRTLTVQDAPDGIPTVSGVPDNPDISQVAVRYDTAGSLTLTVAFYNSLDWVDKSRNYKFWGRFSVGEGSAGYNPATCWAGGTPGDLYGQHNVVGNFYDRASVNGYSGYLNFSTSTSADRKIVSITASSPVLANRNYRCLEYALYARSYSSITNLYSEYDEGCDCWYLSGKLDDIGSGGILSSGVWFDGLQPPPPPPPPLEQLKGKLSIVVGGGCRQATLKSWKVLPSAGGYPLGGNIRVRIGNQVREFPATQPGPIRFKRVRSGWRNMHVVYTGDPRRSAAAADETVRVTTRGCYRR
jgi:hypothetical protein